MGYKLPRGNKMVKKVFLSSLIIIIVPSLLFLLLYSYMWFSVKNLDDTYKEDILASWKATQYYEDNQLIACNDEKEIIFIFEKDKVTIKGNVIENNTYNYRWKGRNTIVLVSTQEEIEVTISMENKDELKLSVNQWNYIITLEKV